VDETSVQQPESGTYGAKATVEKLKQELGSAQQTGAPRAPEPSVSSMPPRPPAQPGTGPAGIPAAVIGPTQRPNVATQTPLMSAPVNPVAGAADARQARLAFWDFVSTNPEVSDETREFAKVVVQRLIGGSKR
jgi:hypothetical protein